MSAVITLLSDYGVRDSYVAEVKAVLVSLAPRAVVVDVTHEVPAGDVRAGQYLLARTWRRFPGGSVHMAIVDPGVGTPRRALAGAASGHFFVGPDNGLLSCVPVAARWVELAVSEEAAPTFHGRDVFAPAAARLASGAVLSDLGLPVTDPLRSPPPVPAWDGAAWLGEVVHVDRFGTLVTNLPAGSVEPGVRIIVGDRDAGPLRRTFGAVPAGHLVAFVGSGGTIEIAVRNGSAMRMLGAGVGTVVRG